MESAEEIECQISAQVAKFNEVTYQAWLDSTENSLEVTLILWPNGPKRTTFIQSLGKSPGPLAWTCDSEEKLLRRKGILKRKNW